MRASLILILLFISCTVFASKPDTAGLRKAVLKLNKALVEKDSATLKKLLHKKVTYGHSNGWVETKRDVIGNLFSGTLVYNNLEQHPLTMTVEEDNVAIVRSDLGIDVTYDGQPIKMKLHVMQVWIKKKKGWLLLGRQSAKADK